MLIVSPDHAAINLDHALTLFVDGNDIEALTPLAMFNNGEVTGNIPTDVAECCSHEDAKKVFDAIIKAYERGDKVFYVPTEFYRCAE